MPLTPDMNGVRKAAVLTMLLGEEATATIFKHLSEEEIEVIAREVTSLGSVPMQNGADVLEEFYQMSQVASYVAHGGVEYAQRLLVRTVGSEAAQRIIDRVVRSFESTAGFTALARADPTQLSKFVLGE